MRSLINGRWILFTVLSACVLPSAVLCAGESASGGSQDVAAQIGSTAKKVGEKIERGITRTAKKIEEKDIPAKVERKLKKAVTKTEEGFKKAGQKIDQKLSQ